MGKRETDPYKEAKKGGVSLEAFVIPQKVAAFVDAYQPCDEDFATEIFDESRLRNFFKAWLTSAGDPLALYLEDLEKSGFRLQVGKTGEPAIFVTEKNIKGSLTNELLESKEI